jgi:hypothetical protein
VGTSKTLARYKGSTISLRAAVHLGHMPRVLMTKKKNPAVFYDPLNDGGSTVHCDDRRVHL